MEFTIPKLVTYIGAWFGMMGGVWALFDRAETVLKPEIRKNLSSWLKRSPNSSQSNWAQIFTGIFDRVFGEKHFSLKCFFRSALCSFLSVTIIALLITAVYGWSFWDGFEMVGSGVYLGLLYFLSLTMAVNIFPDYLSLLETRYILGYMSRLNALGRMLCLIIDLIVTSLILICSLTLFIIIGNFVQSGILFEDPLLEYFTQAVGFSYMGLKLSDEGFFTFPFLAPWVYSTYLTSAWVWTFFLMGLGVRIFGILGLGIRRVGTLFDIDNKPLKSLGFLAMVVVTFLFMIIPIL